MDFTLCIIMSLAVLVTEVVLNGITALITGIRKTKYRKLYRLSFLVALIECVLFLIYMNSIGMFGYGDSLESKYGILAFIYAAIPFFVPYFDKQYRKEYLPSNAEIQEKKQREYEEQKRQIADKILKTRYMNGDTVVTSKLSASSAVGRAVVGNAIAGDIGAIVGASTAKQKTKEKHTTTFLVFYKDGHKNIETVEDGTLQFEVYVDKLEIE